LQLPNFSSADRYGPAYELGRWIRNNWSEISGFVSDPFNIAMFLLAVLLLAVVLAATIRIALRVLRASWAMLFPRAGEITLGHRREKALDVVLDPPVTIGFEDRRKGGCQILGPTGQGKTTLMLNMVLQDLAQGHTAVVLETDGDLGPRLLPYVEALGLNHRFLYLDPTFPESAKWNPLGGDPEKVVNQAVDTIASVSSGHEFYQDFNEDVVRHMTGLVCACARDLGVEPTVKALLNFLTDARHLEQILDLDADGGRVRVGAPFVGGELRAWLEQEFFAWSERMRREYLVGLRNLFRKLLSGESVIEVLTPRKGDTTLEVGGALQSGGLIVVRAPSEALGHVGSQTLATWFLQRVQHETIGRSMPMRPVCFYLDEAHVVLGRRNTAAADSFASWFVQVRKFNVAPHTGYQSFSQLPDPLKHVLDSSARNKLISGGLYGEDAHHAQRLLGHTRKPETEVRELGSETLFGPKRRQRVTRTVEAPCYSIGEIENLPLGRWFFRGVRGKRQLSPTVLRVKEPPTPGRLRIRAPGARKAGKRGRRKR
jgi:Type IV secretion-system coupling protein DNA-binding domain